MRQSLHLVNAVIAKIGAVRTPDSYAAYICRISMPFGSH